MSEAIVKDTGTGAALLLAQGQMLDIALRAAAQLKNARGMLPESLKSEGEIVAVLLAGQELGLPAMVSLRGLQVVRGKIIISYDTMIALLRRAGYRIAWPVSTATCATLRLTAPDGETHTETWDEARAKKAGLWGSGVWAKFPDTMLRARCVSSAARAFAGEVLSGVYVEGEIEDQPRTEGPAVGFAEALHEHPPAVGAFAVPPELAEQVEIAMHALGRCLTADDVHSWIDTYATTISKQPASDEKAAQWKAIQRKAAGVTPPIRSDALTRAFGAALMRAKTAAPDVVEGITEDGEVTPGARAMAELQSVETREAAMAWVDDNRAWLAGIEVNSSEDRIVWQAIRARCGDETTAAMEQAIS